jgi:hypothetical protein
MTEGRQSFLLWFGVAAAPLAWTLELVAGYWFEDAACTVGGLNDKLWLGLTFALTAVVAAAGLAAAFASLRAVREGAGDARGRAEFIAIAGLSTALVFLVLTVMTGIGILSLDPCKG